VAITDQPSYYELLQIGPDASAKDLRQAFRSLSKRYHPDTTELPQQQAQEAFRQLQQAYLTLSDPDRRQRLRRHPAGDPARPGTPTPRCGGRTVCRTPAGAACPLRWGVVRAAAAGPGGCVQPGAGGGAGLGARCGIPAGAQLVDR